jgi:hypothetical protein
VAVGGNSLDGFGAAIEQSGAGVARLIEARA